MRTRPLVMIGALTVFVGCVRGGPSTTPLPSSSHDVLVLETAQASIVVDTEAGAVLADAPGAVVGPDGNRLYTATSDGSTTMVEVRDAVDGTLLSTAPFPGALDVRVASLSGRLIAMTARLASTVDPWAPSPRSTSTILVTDARASSPMRTYRLAGNYEPEAFSVDDARLFLIQYLPAENPTAYRVMFLDLATGRVHPVFGRFESQPERMPGDRLRQIFDPTTFQLYTLYTNHSDAYDDDYWSAGQSDDLTFVHVLNLQEGWAYCAGLPRALWNHPANAEAMTPSPDGRILYVVDSTRGVIAEMDTRTLKIVARADVDLGSGSGNRTSIVASPDGATLFVSSAADPNALYVLDARKLDVTARWTLGGPVWDVGLSRDGSRLYAALTDRIAVLDPTTGSATSFVPISGVSSILHVASPGP
jgi:hypothetical protein